MRHFWGFIFLLVFGTLASGQNLSASELQSKPRNAFNEEFTTIPYSCEKEGTDRFFAVASYSQNPLVRKNARGDRDPLFTSLYEIELGYSNQVDAGVEIGFLLPIQRLYGGIYVSNSNTPFLLDGLTAELKLAPSRNFSIVLSATSPSYPDNKELLILDPKDLRQRYFLSYGNNSGRYGGTLSYVEEWDDYLLGGSIGALYSPGLTDSYLDQEFQIQSSVGFKYKAIKKPDISLKFEIFHQAAKNSELSPEILTGFEYRDQSGSKFELSAGTGNLGFHENGTNALRVQLMASFPLSRPRPISPEAKSSVPQAVTNPKADLEQEKKVKNDPIVMESAAPVVPKKRELKLIRRELIKDSETTLLNGEYDPKKEGK